MLGAALVGIVVNVAASWLIAGADRTSLNVEGAFQHILNDLFAFIATAIAGLVVILTGWVWADTVAAIIVAGLMAEAAWGLIRDSWRIFLEAAPHDTDVAAIDTDLHAVDAASRSTTTTPRRTVPPEGRQRHGRAGRVRASRGV